MEHTRVKYDKDGMSKKQYLSNDGTMLKVSVNKGLGNPTEYTVNLFKVEDDGGVTLVSVITSPTLHKAKILAKALLKEHGVKFFDEARNRNKKEVTE
jgi:hypothetical protein